MLVAPAAGDSEHGGVPCKPVLAPSTSASSSSGGGSCGTSTVVMLVTTMASKPSPACAAPVVADPNAAAATGTAAALWWAAVSALLVFGGGVLFCLGSAVYFVPGWPPAAWLCAVLYAVGSCGFLSVDAIGVLDAYGCIGDHRGVGGGVDRTPSAGWWLRANLLFGACGTALYVTGSVGFVPTVFDATRGRVGVYGFLIGSVIITVSQGWKLLRIGSRAPIVSPESVAAQPPPLLVTLSSGDTRAVPLLDRSSSDGDGTQLQPLSPGGRRRRAHSLARSDVGSPQQGSALLIRVAAAQQSAAVSAAVATPTAALTPASSVSALSSSACGTAPTPSRADAAMTAVLPVSSSRPSDGDSPPYAINRTSSTSSTGSVSNTGGEADTARPLRWATLWASADTATSSAVELSFGVGAVLFLAGTIVFDGSDAAQSDATSHAYLAVAGMWLVGSVLFAAGGVVLLYRRYALQLA